MPTGSHLFKTCTSCGKVKPLKHFWKRWANKSNRHEQCRACKLKKRREWMARRGSDYTTEWKKKTSKNWESYHNSVDKYNAKKVGLSWDEFLRISKEQNGLCMVCKKSNTIKYNRRLVLDHNHSTGKFRGLLCHHCNMLLGACREDVEILIAAGKYLEYASYAESFSPAGLGC